MNNTLHIRIDEYALGILYRTWSYTFQCDRVSPLYCVPDCNRLFVDTCRFQNYHRVQESTQHFFYVCPLLNDSIDSAYGCAGFALGTIHS